MAVKIYYYTSSTSVEPVGSDHSDFDTEWGRITEYILEDGTTILLSPKSLKETNGYQHTT